MTADNHYKRTGLTEAILAALTAGGTDLARLTINDLAPVDELHVRGRKATAELAELLAPAPDSLLLEIGCGIGGAARYLAATHGCRVTGIDLTSDYCRAARVLSGLTGLTATTAYICGDATALPFPDARFDSVWTVHTAMNIPDKQGLYREIRRVLKPGGTLALYDILAGSGGPIHTPVPWARRPEQSHLLTPPQLRQLLTDSGLTISHWQDRTEEGRVWFSRLAQRTGSTPPPPLGVQLLFGADFPAMAANQVRNLNEARIVLLECLAKRR